MYEYVTIHTGFKEYVVNNLVIVNKACLTFLVLLLVFCTYDANYVDKNKIPIQAAYQGHTRILITYAI